MKTNSDKRTILIVDDTPANIQVAHNILKDTYIIKIATSGAAALKVAKMFPQPDLIRVLSVSLRDVGWTRSLGSNSRWEAAGNEPKTDGIGSGADRAIAAAIGGVSPKPVSAGKAAGDDLGCGGGVGSRLWW